MEPTERKAVKRDGDAERSVVEVAGVRFGHDPFPVIAGPCAIESETQLMQVAQAVADAGGAVLRANAYKPGSSPYDFSGLGEAGLVMLQEAGDAVGLPTVSQVLEPAHVEAAAERVDMIEIHSGAMQNFELLKVAGRTGKPVLLRRAPSATVDEWLWAAEYVLAEGNPDLVMVERGIRTFGGGSADTLDIGSIPELRERSHLPVIVDPSHAAGGATKVGPLALAAQGVGADGVVLEVHPDPATAQSNPSQLTLEEWAALMFRLGVNRMRAHIDLVDREIVRLLARRQELSLEIGRVKAERGLPIFAPERERELMDVIRREAELCGIRPDHVEALFHLVLAESRSVQEIRGD